VTNRNILQGLLTNLDEAKGRWAEELLSMMWTYHTMPCTATGEMPFNLVFDIEAIIPIELGLPLCG